MHGAIYQASIPVSAQNRITRLGTRTENKTAGGPICPPTTPLGGCWAGAAGTISRILLLQNRLWTSLLAYGSMNIKVSAFRSEISGVTMMLVLKRTESDNKGRMFVNENANTRTRSV